MPDHLTITLLIASDAHRLLTAYAAMLKEIHAAGFPEDERAAERRINREIWPGLNRGVGYALLDGQEIVGFSVWDDQIVPGERANGIELALWVAPEWRRQGWAKKLRARCQAILTERHAGKVQFLSQTFLGNPAMRSLLLADGFEPVATTFLKKGPE